MTTSPPEGLENSLDMLFSTDPEQLSDEQFTQIILAFRAKRETWLLSEGKPAKAKKASTAVAAPTQLSLEDLNL